MTTSSTSMTEIPEDLAGWQWEQSDQGIRLAQPDEGYATPWGPADYEARHIVAARKIHVRDHQIAADVCAQTAPAPVRRGRGVQLSTSAAPAATADDGHTPLLVKLALIDDNPFQPRLAYDDTKIAALATSIKEHGLLQVPLARQMPDGRYQLAFGHSRRRGFALLAQDDQRYSVMPLLLRTIDDETMALHAWTENKDRSDLTTYEEVAAIQTYMQHFGWSQTQAAERLKLDRSTVSNKLRLLKLPGAALDQLRAGQLSERQAMALLPLADLPESCWQRTFSIHTPPGGWVPNLNEFVKKAHEFDSSSLRAGVDQVLSHLTVSLANKSWFQEDFSGENSVQAGRCKECPIRLKAANACPDAVCAERKTTIHQRRLATNAAEQMRLPAVTISSYGTFDDLAGVQLPAIIEMATKRQCGTLGVAYNERYWSPQKVDGHEHCAVVCAHGAGKRCQCKAALARSADPEVSKEAKDRHERQRIKAELAGPATGVFVTALERPSAAIYRWLFKAVSHTAGSKLPADADADTVRTALAKHLVENAIAYYLENSPNFANAQSTLDRLFEDLGISAPWAASAEPPDPAAVIREHLSHAREVAGIAMAHYHLEQAQQAAMELATRDIDLAVKLQDEINQVEAMIAATEQS